MATASFFSAALVTAGLTTTSANEVRQPEYLPVYPTKQQLVQLVLTVIGFRIAHTLLTTYLSRVEAHSRFHRLSPYFLSGLTFSFGLSLSGMADPQKVLSFLIPLDIDHFDPSLAMVVLSGVIPNAIHWARLEKGKVRLNWENWAVPTRSDIDWKLVVGSMIFGVGWGLAGVCPGPAIVGVGRVLSGLVAGEAVAPVASLIGSFVSSMIAGMAVIRYAF